MKRLSLRLAVLCCLLLCCLPAAAQTLFAYSTIDALLSGSYDGELTLRQLAIHGNFGIGTFNHLDGEMILLDGVFYHAHADGTVSVASPAKRTPLASVTRFRPTQTLRTDDTLALGDLEKLIDARLANPNLFYAIRIDGLFADAAVRAISPQQRPYKPLATLVATQSVHQFQSVRGTLVGIRSPAFSKGISVPGYHWHLLTADRRQGGHVLRLTLSSGSVRIATLSDFTVQLPRSDEFAHSDQTKDRTDETRRVEGR